MGVSETVRRTIERQERQEEAVAVCGCEGLPPFWSSLQTDGGHMVMLGERAGHWWWWWGSNLFRSGRVAPVQVS